VEQLKALGAEVGTEDRAPGDVGRRPREACDEPGSHRLADAHHHDRNRVRCLLGYLGRRRSVRHDEINVPLNEISRELR
jgi:hypothetical protein